MLTARRQGALLRLDYLHPALAQGRQVRLRRRVGVHAVVHRRRDQPRGGTGQEGGCQHRVRDPSGELGHGVGGGGSDQVGVAVGGQLEVPDRVVLRARVSGKAAAQRIPLELGDEDGGADDALEGGGADEAGRPLGHQHPHAVACHGGETG